MDNYLALLISCFCVFCVSGCANSSPNIGQMGGYTIHTKTNKPDVKLGTNIDKSLELLRRKIIPKLRTLNEKQRIVLYVDGYHNAVNTLYEPLPIGGSRGGAVPSHNALEVFYGSGIRIIPGKCPQGKTDPNTIRLQIATTVSSFDETSFTREGWELTAEDSMNTAVVDTANWEQKSILGMHTQLLECNEDQLIDSIALPLLLISQNKANSFLAFSKALGLYYTNSTTNYASPQLDRDKGSLFSIMRIAAGIALLSEKEMDEVIYGVNMSYDQQTGLLQTRIFDDEFDGSQALLVITYHLFGEKQSETIVIPYGEMVRIKSRGQNRIASYKNGVRKMSVSIQHFDEIIYNKSLI